MELIVTHRARLIKAYGESGWKAIQSALDDYLDTLNSVGIDADLFLLEELAPNVETESKDLKVALQSLHHKHEAKYLLFLGGHEVIPFYRRPDGTQCQSLDQHILSDTYYVDFEESELEHWPEMAVGRLPGGGSSSDLLVDQLRRAATMHSAGGIPLPESYIGFSAEVWKTASKQTYSRFDKSCDTLRLCPPLGNKVNILTGVTEAISAEHLLPNGILFFNVHGHRQKPQWLGEQRILGLPAPLLPELLNYELVSRADLTNSVILCEACHGAAIHNHTLENSLALCALKRGALAFFGCTATSYAFTIPEGKPSGVSGIDALFQSLIHSLIVQKTRFGGALSEAKQLHSAFYNVYDEKNVLSLVLLGDPMLRFQ